MGVDVDEAGRDKQPGGVDRAGRGAGDGTDVGDDVAVDGDIGAPARRPGAVDDLTTTNHELVVSHGLDPTTASDVPFGTCTSNTM